MKFSSFAKALIAVGLLAGAAPSYAVLINCGPSGSTDLTGHVTNSAGTVTAASDCQYIFPADNSTTADATNVNAAGFFSSTSWVQVGSKTEISGEGGSGTWAISGTVDFTNNDYIIVFKDGSETNLTAFLLNELYSSGSWTTPFTDPPFALNGNSTSHGVSHWAIFATVGDGGGGGGGGQVPEPATILLFGAGLAGLGLMRRRRVV